MTTNAEDTLILETTKGPVTIVMRPDLAPNDVAGVARNWCDRASTTGSRSTA